MNTKKNPTLRKQSIISEWVDSYHPQASGNFPHAINSTLPYWMVNRPRCVKVVNLDFKVTWVNKEMENGSAKFGWCDLNNQSIFISDSLSPKKTADTFLHEFIHSLNWTFGIVDGAKEEDITLRLATGICALWIDNPDVCEWWNGLLKISCVQSIESESTIKKL